MLCSKNLFSFTKMSLIKIIKIPFFIKKKEKNMFMLLDVLFPQFSDTFYRRSDYLNKLLLNIKLLLILVTQNSLVLIAI